ncbi:tRNA threonylcarbamoyl adenosine modification protein YeaZ [Blastomonas natatoria]|uniref:tRNA threonylcarbamoyl adenosine modification protein YeaZ n=1 Tax=Blastomonas natatoria TaxID=34015 RepID=A0A2V3V3X2_9SPHN|nr:tRNA (adenosine(37)-N6)-threonylcarbamoyltransferase complex dimerization subunit type 1 TsaB [Blastomonas natatoria]PXW76446.1 tRNA threonylcarbamoyl adenosine modification protein YeaZ [Blastomonas natatoria]
MPPEPHKLLVIDTATEACSVALFAGDELLASEHAVMGRGHAERLVPMIATLPQRGRADAILVNCGPGSFTGVRVGLAAARALALAWNVPVSGYATHSLVAATALASHPDADAVDVVMTGGHGEYFVQSFGREGAALGPLASLLPDAAHAVCGHELVAGSMAETLVAARGFGTAVALLPDARQALLLTEAARSLPADPIYGRGADAKPMAMQAPR